MKRGLLVVVCVFLGAWRMELSAQSAQELLRSAKNSERDNPAKAVEIYQKIVANHPTDAPACAEAYLGMGLCLTEQGRRDEAKTAVEKATTLCPDNADFRKVADVVLFRLREGLRQVHLVEVDKEGRVRFITDMRNKNSTGKELKVFKFHTDMGTLIEVKDALGNKVPFDMEETERGADYRIQLPNPIPPGGEVFYQTVWEMDSLLACKEGSLRYHFGPHCPGPRALYEHVLTLPAASDIRVVSPPPALVRDTDAAKTIVWQQEIEAGKSMDEVRAEFVIPNVDASRLPVPDYFEVIHKQSNVTTVDSAGKAICCVEETRKNNVTVPLSSIHFSSSPQVKLTRILDERDNELQFTATPGANPAENTHYTVSLRNAIPPGEERSFRFFFEWDGLVSREGDLWVFQYRHSPNRDTLYSHTLRLPGGAEIVEVVPKADDTAVVDGMKTIVWTSTVTGAGHFSCRVKYRLPAAK
ncbi:MAG: tetratricopeptide repeat protein [Planctomycetota bacterium]